MANRDFGNIIAGEFAKAVKGKKAKDKSFYLVIINAGGQKMTVRVTAAGPDSFEGYVRNRASEGFSTTITVFNPDQVVGYERA